MRRPLFVLVCIAEFVLCTATLWRLRPAVAALPPWAYVGVLALAMEAARMLGRDIALAAGSRPDA